MTMHAKQRQRATPRRSTVFLLFIGLSLATGIALLGLARVLAAGPTVSPAGLDPASANSAVIRTFYAAANRALSTGDLAGLTSILAPNLIEHHDPARSVSGREELSETLVSLHAGFPTAQLAVDDLVAQADEVVARVHLTGVGPGQFASLALSPALAVWGEIDVFRLVNGVIVEHWGGRDSAVQLRPLQRATLVLPYARRVVSATRFTFLPAEAYALSSWSGPKLLYIESGQLAVTISPSLSAQQEPAVRTRSTNGIPSAGEWIRPGQTVTLGAGDVLALPHYLYGSAVGGAGVSTVCLEIALPLTAPFTVEETDGPQIQRFADNLPDPMPSGAMAVVLGEVTLAPETTLPISTTTGSTLAVVESGKLGMTMRAGEAWAQGGATGTTFEIGQFGNELLPVVANGAGAPPGRLAMPPTPVLPLSATLAPRDTVLVEAGARGIIRNAGDTPLTLLMVTLTPAHPVPGTPVATSLGRPYDPQ